LERTKWFALLYAVGAAVVVIDAVVPVIAAVRYPGAPETYP
jgi:hypothetical protein